MHQTLTIETGSPEAQGLSSPKFDLGRIVSTTGALAALEAAGCSPLTFLARHAQGDWGDALPPEDAALNDRAVAAGPDGGRILSSYRLAGGERIWIITDQSREVGNLTTFLKPVEY